ncbi:MAG: hypothetical protein ACJA0I_001077 [Gammaproteobacteria bacterium]|jgi:hypothetical protein
MSKIVYKYRGFHNFEHLVDILVNSRIYAAGYASMNDPMEGCYTFDNNVDKKIIDNLENEIEKIKFCSLSESSNIDLMWSHYANGNRGVCIGVEVKENSNFDELRTISYDGQQNLTAVQKLNPRELLCHKNKCWNYEEEVRVFPKTGHLIDVDVKEVIFGKRVDRQLAPLVKELMSKFQLKAIILKQK